MRQVKTMQQDQPFKTYTMDVAPLVVEPVQPQPDDPVIQRKTLTSYAVNTTKIRDMSKAELMAWAVETQPSELELRLTYAIWSRTDPTAPAFEGEYQAFAVAARRAGWGLSEKARKASAQDAGKEAKPMMNVVSEKVATLAKQYATAHAVTFDVAMERVLDADADLKARYVAAPAYALLRPPTPPPFAPMHPVTDEVDKAVKAYMRERGVTSYDEALAAVAKRDPTLLKRYIAPGRAVEAKAYGLLHEESYETLVAGLTREQLMELMIERRLAESGIPSGAGDTLCQLAAYEWLVAHGFEHGSLVAAQERDAMWREVLKRRFAKYGFSTPPGR